MPGNIAPRPGAPEKQGDGGAPLVLERYFPYRLAILAQAVSHTVAQLYSDRFDLTRQQWRVLAALGANREMAAKDIAGQAALEKMQVSRAVAGLEQRGLIVREEDANDRRNKILRLTAAGQGLYRQIVPLALEREANLVAALEESEVAQLDRIMTKLLNRARELRRSG